MKTLSSVLVAVGLSFVLFSSNCSMPSCPITECDPGFTLNEETCECEADTASEQAVPSTGDEQSGTKETRMDTAEAEPGIADEGGEASGDSA